MANNSHYRRLNVYLAKSDCAHFDFDELLTEGSPLEPYPIDPKLEFDGILYAKQTRKTRPNWSKFVDEFAGKRVKEVENKSSSAVIFLRIDAGLFAFTFGYGKSLVNTGHFVQDFGIKTALNVLDHESLRSVDLHTIDDQPVQKKTQAARESDARVFGIDVSKDVLRAVTGAPRDGIDFKNITGADSAFSFGAKFELEELPRICRELVSHYEAGNYEEEFAWVDNIRRIKSKDVLASLDEELVRAIETGSEGVFLTLPAVRNWDKIEGFSFTGSRKLIRPTLEPETYFSGIDRAALSIEKLKSDRLFVHEESGFIEPFSIYKCVYLEKPGDEKTFLLFGGVWFEVDTSFMGRINSALEQIGFSDLNFPSVKTWREGGKEKIESEGNYNNRAASECGYFLLDQKNVKSNRTTSPIEFCDLCTSEKQLVHVKHRKGGSSSLSHLFAQGKVSAEVMLGDKDFRKAARKVLRKVDPDAREIVPLDGIKAEAYEIVFHVLGVPTEEVLETLPFFSKVNLANTLEGLSQRGFTVKISGASKVSVDAPK